jgi:hypothetical protein
MTARVFFSLASQNILLVLLGLSLAVGTARAQAPTWQAAVALAQGAGGESLTYAVAAGYDGDVYVAGHFEGTLLLGTTILNAGSSHNIFVAKWNAFANTFMWAVQAGGPGLNIAYALAVEGANVYVAGYYSQGPATFGSTQLPTYGNTDGYVAKLVDAGPSATWAWAQHLGGVGNDRAKALAVQGNNVYVAGTYILGGTASQATFGTIQLPTLGGANGYVAKLVDAGPTATWAWATAVQGTGSAEAMALAATPGGVYVGGDITFGTVGFGTQQLTSAGNSDGYVAKLLDTGSTATWAWAVRLGGPDYEHVQAVAASGNRVYVSGDYGSATVTLGPLALPNAGNTDGFVAKLTDAGSSAAFTWARAVGGVFSESVRALTVQGSTVYLAGYLSSASVAFGGTTLGTAAGYQPFLARLTDQGPTPAYAWALGTSGTSYNMAYALAATPTGDLYVGGELRGTASFGSHTITGVPLNTNATVAWAHDGSLLATAAPAAPTALTLSPNPAHSQVTVQLPTGLAAGLATLTLLDNVGRSVRARAVALAAGSTQTTFDVAGLAPGVYALRVAVGERTGTTRLVVE